jgi:predicted nuclease with TOPRIM domain
MTIKQMADKLGVTPQAIYQKLKKNGVEVYKLTDKKTKELTAEAEVIISKLFAEDQSEIKPSKQKVVESLQEQIQQLRTDNAVLVERVKSLEAEVSTLSTDKDLLTKALEKAQDLHQKTLDRFLPAAGETSPAAPRKLTWKERFTGKTK